MGNWMSADVADKRKLEGFQKIINVDLSYGGTEKRKERTLREGP